MLLFEEKKINTVLKLDNTLENCNIIDRFVEVELHYWVFGVCSPDTVDSVIAVCLSLEHSANRAASEEDSIRLFY